MELPANTCIPPEWWVLGEKRLRRRTRQTVTAEIRERFQQLQNLAQNYAFLRPEVILSMDELNLDQALQDINKEFQLERVRLQAFVAATDPGCKKELIRPGSLGLLKYIIGPNLRR
ncbi:uncharacterized protein TNCV_2847741 [Trichonephila clavipes]|nr:uncharacterized protein TNCV_2847741 [Trichonephila clavipes]